MYTTTEIISKTCKISATLCYQLGLSLNQLSMLQYTDVGSAGSRVVNKRNVLQYQLKARKRVQTILTTSQLTKLASEHEN